MLTHLTIKNFALIEELSISFSDGFSIITGETGAGKSILLGALGLILGKRADLSSLKNKDEKCVIEGVFMISKYQLKSFFDENDLDYEEQTIIRREILPSGKSRAFINDSPVNLSELVLLGEMLIDIHSQHQTSELAEENFQFAIIDAIADNRVLLENYTLKLKAFRKLKSSFEELENSLTAALKEQDYNSFLYNELVEAKLIENEQLELESDLEKLTHAELIKEQFEKSISLAESDQFGLLVHLKEVKTAIQKISTFSNEYAELFNRIDSLTIELKDIVAEMNQMAETVVHDPIQLENIQQKLQVIYSLQKKHQVTSVEELLQIQNELQNKVISVTTLEEQKDSLFKAIEACTLELNELASKIHQNRIKSIPLLNDLLVKILVQLGMPNVQFDLKITATNVFYSNGKDTIQFLISTNRGSDFGLLKKVASGGEMSRIMLAVKSILANYTNLPTLILDEIDTGVSGEIADKMGEIMKEMSGKMQLFAITHLPQIAAKGDMHYKVYKSDNELNTKTEIKKLSIEERVLEIAQMLSGSSISESAINHAKALLN
ncbi:DNA repair protein RecN [Flavobacterium filum]|uniref:DNA repair protein RecN n=1 Tax=Flavobacterium filum TaxID=370974 RepID=UPI0023F29BBE|nr:DNA repair protein RecN [Flavobacterium filum]